MARTRPAPTIYGVDFTSAPRRAKPITVAAGRFDDGVLALYRIDRLENFAAFEAWLVHDGPWVAGFDFPFGLPREALVDLGWPLSWPRLAAHCRSLGRAGMRMALDEHRRARPVGNKFCYRRGDSAAGSHSPLKLVNPPVALMFLEGAPRLIEAGVTVPGMHDGDPDRIALEAYPGYAVRRIVGSRARVSYKNDAPGKQTPEHRGVRSGIIAALAAQGLEGIRLRCEGRLRQSIVDDGSGDLLDAAICALQAAWGQQRCASGYGLPGDLDPVEGWIVTVPSGPLGDSGNIRA